MIIRKPFVDNGPCPHDDLYRVFADHCRGLARSRP